MISHTCAQCGAVNTEAGTCRFCVAPVSQNSVSRFGSPGPSPRTEGNLAVAVDWRTEVAQRLHAHRTRRQKLCPDSAQPGLPFAEAGAPLYLGDLPATPATVPSAPPAPKLVPAPLPPPAVHARARALRGRAERMVIDLAQPALDFDDPRRHRAARLPPILAQPAAPLAQRGRAAALDLTILLVAFGAFLAIFSALGGQWTLSRQDLTVTVATFVLFYAQYFALFILCGGATPGMRLRHLRVIAFDGAEATPQQLSWRCLGYLVSGCTLVGFAWAVWDDDQLSWHDRISHTCLVATATLPENAPFEQASPAAAHIRG